MPLIVIILKVYALWWTIGFCWIETSANVLTEWLHFESGLVELVYVEKGIQHFEM